MHVARLLLLIALWTISAGAHAEFYKEATVYISPQGSPRVRMGLMDRNGAAYGFYNHTLQTIGWGLLDVKTGAVDDKTAMYAAGYLEGVVTAPLIVANVANMRQFWTSRISAEKWAKVMNFMAVQDAWIRQFAASSTDPIALAVARITDQLDGLLAGAQSMVGVGNITKGDILMLQNTGDLIDLTKAVDKEKHTLEALFRRLDAMSPRARRQHVALSGMCSALVVFTPGLEDVLMSHVAWFTYSATMRIYKHYNFALRDNPWPAPRTSFSSYAGYLESLDDFYILGSRMVMLQTTNSVFNGSLYSLVTPKSLPAWYRVRAANHLATSGAEWASIMAKENSGTYNNQYMVIDLKRIQLKRQAEAGALTIVEQIPGLVEWSDQTPILADGHWPSYNVPFQTKVYNLSGYPEFVARYGLGYSYQMAPRAKLFRRDAAKVRTLDDLKTLMRSNNYKTDPYSDNDPTAAVCARGDLVSPKGSPDGCYDGKVTNYRMALNFQSEAISGPTTSNNTLPPFSWRKFPFSKLPHRDLPVVYNFKWQLMHPRL